MLNNIKQAIKQLDFFEHPSLLRYQTQPGYRTLTGGLISVVIIIIFAVVFGSKIIQTLTNMNANGQTNITYDTDPKPYHLIANPHSQHFMFAVGISELDLTTQKYFDFVLQNFVSIKNSSGSFDFETSVSLKPCDISQWSGINDDITTSFNTLSFSKWLCPPTDTIFPLRGKYTSPAFQYSRILVRKCKSANCATQSQISTYINIYQEGVAVNFYYINPIINSGDIDYLNYYLQDSNYFTFNTVTGVNANLYFSEYTITTDHSIFPWKDRTEDQGALTSAPANTQIYTIASDQYARIYLRKSSQTLQIIRNFTKIDETLAFIGGLLGFFLLLLTFMKVYNKFCFELEFGDRVFKKNQNGTFGSQHFNFIVFLGYGLYNTFTIFGMHLKWKTMRKYHECRTECLKQLDIHLLFKKIEFLEQVANIVLQDHHVKGIFMLPKKKIKEVQQSRRKFLLQSLLYHQLDRKAREVVVQQKQYKQRYEQFFSKEEPQQQQGQKEDLKKLQTDFTRSYKMLQLQSNEGNKYSQKIFGKLGMKQVLSAIFKQFRKQDKPNYQEPMNSIQKLGLGFQNIQKDLKNNKDANMDEKQRKGG